MQYQDDNFYIDKILGGDTAAYASLIDKHKTMAYNIAWRILKSREDAEEIAQDSFLKVYYSLKEFKRESKFSTWLFRIVYNNTISRVRKKKLDVDSFDDENYEWMEPADTAKEMERLSQNEQKKYVNDAISRLPEEDATVITLFYMNESSIEEISTVTGLSQSNVKVKLFRSRKRLHEELQNMLKEELVDII
ncbi:MAG: RNA polymerase sigma factor [Bacteroidia bacterium]